MKVCFHQPSKPSSIEHIIYEHPINERCSKKPRLTLHQPESDYFKQLENIWEAATHSRKNSTHPPICEPQGLGKATGKNFYKQLARV